MLETVKQQWRTGDRRVAYPNLPAGKSAPGSEVPRTEPEAFWFHLVYHISPRFSTDSILGSSLETWDFEQGRRVGRLSASPRRRPRTSVFRLS